MDADEEVKKHGRKRVRTKGLQKKLQEQIEFYFGNANLQKDRFLQQKMKEHPDGYISVETIAGFNKMKSLTTNLSMVVQVMKKSELVELSSDEKWVRRSIPLPTATDTDNRTVYVEHLPANSTHDSIGKLFKVFGDISYVSLPRHKSSGAIKGFCFIEFATAEEAAVVIKYFKSGTKPVTPSGTCKSFPDKSATLMDVSEEQEGEGEKDGDRAAGGERGGGGEQKEEMGIKGEEADKGGEVKGGERETEEKGGEVESSMEEGASRKRKRDKDTSEGSECPDVKEGDQATPPAKKSRRGDSKTDEAAPLEGEGGTAESSAGSEQKEELREERGKPGEDYVQSRKRKRMDDEVEGEKDKDGGKEREREGEKGGEGEGERGGSDSVPATTAVKLDPQSLDKGDKSTSETGDETEAGREQKRGRKKNRQHKKRDWEAALKNLRLRVMPKKEWLEMRGIFRNLQKEKVREMKQQLKEEGGATGGGRADKGFVARCLVKVEGVGRGEGEEVVTIEKVQEICSKYGVVAYTDMEEGASEGYIRYAKSGCVENLVNAETSTHVKFTAVSEEDERAYYLKTVASRKQLAKSKRAKKKCNIRGQDKIISRALQHQSHKVSEASEAALPAATHTRFSDSDHES